MSASPLNFLRAGPPPPRVALLPDALFFSRSVPISANATPAEAAAQVELAVEGMSPFPLAQLYHGFYWLPGSAHAIAFASYRRRFTAEQTAGWADAELVIPASAALFGATVEPATTALLSSDEGLTAIHWEAPGVPARVLFRPIDPEATDEDRARVREELVREMGGSRTVIDLAAPPLTERSSNDREFVFRSGDLVSRLPVEASAALDVRDKAELATLRASRRRDLMLWRIALGCAAALLLLLVAEVALVGGQTWRNSLRSEVASRRDEVNRIRAARDLSDGVQDLITKRFLPIEMLTAILGPNAERKPATLVITRIRGTASNNPFSIVLELQTPNAGEPGAFQEQIRKMPECESANLEIRGSGALTQAILTVTFKPGSLKAEPST